MPWNQPGSGNNSGDNKDPWGQNRGSQGPPDLDELVKNLQNKLSGMFGGRGGGSGSSSGGGSSTGGGFKASRAFIVVVLLVLLGVWIVTGFYTVQQGEAGVVLRFGRHTDTTQAGLRWHLPYPIETVELVNVQKVNTAEVGYRFRNNQNASVPREALMLTADENIINIQFAVQYDIKDPTDLLFHVADNVEQTVRAATESAVREIVGRNTMDFAITEGRAEIAQETKLLLQDILDRYLTGINIRAVEMQNAQPPAEVKPAFDDAVKAREDEERLKNIAEAYANDVIPRARGQAARVLQEAEGYKASVIAKADGEASRFEKVLDAYNLAPEVTRDRLYLESIEQVMSNSTKVMIDQQGGNNIIYLPLDQILRQQRAPGGAQSNLDAGGGIDSEFDIGVRGERLSRTGRTQR